MTHQTRPGIVLTLTDAVAAHRTLTLPAKLRAGAAAAMPGRDPASLVLERAFPHKRETFDATDEELIASGLVRAIDKRIGKRPRIELSPLALPRARRDDDPRRYYAIIDAPVIAATLDALAGHRKPARGLLLVHRLLRETFKRGAAHQPIALLADDLALPPTSVRRMIADLTAARVIEQHPETIGHEPGVPVLTVPLAARRYPIELSRLRPDKTRTPRRFNIAGESFTVAATDKEADGIEGKLLAAQNDEQTARRIAALGTRLAGKTIGASELFALLANVAPRREPPAPITLEKEIPF